jgi:hypothetical protein
MQPVVVINADSTEKAFGALDKMKKYYQLLWKQKEHKFVLVRPDSSQGRLLWKRGFFYFGTAQGLKFNVRFCSPETIDIDILSNAVKISFSTKSA